MPLLQNLRVCLFFRAMIIYDFDKLSLSWLRNHPMTKSGIFLVTQITLKKKNVLLQASSDKWLKQIQRN